jgi:MFS family permease
MTAIADDTGSTEVSVASAWSFPNFRIFFIGGAISNAGRWMTLLTLPYVLNEMTDRGLWVGIGGAAGFAPAALMGPWAGSLADRYPRRRILLISQSASAVVAAALALMWAAEIRSPVAFVLVAMVGGIVGGLGIPSWQAFISELVPRETLLQAVSLNSTQFSLARAVGPVIAGILLIEFGPTVTFAVDAISFGAALTAIAMIRVPRQPVADRGDRKVLGELIDTLGYIRGRAGLTTAVGTGVVIGMFGMSLTTLLVLFVDDVYEVDDSWLGWMTGLLGIGAVLGAPFVARAKVSIPRSRLELGSLLLYGSAIAVFALSPSFGVALAVLPLIGAAHIVTAAVLNTSLQLQVEEIRRGKVLSVYLTFLLMSVPIGQFTMGALSDVIGVRTAVAGGAAGLLASAAYLQFSGRLTSLDEG